MLISGREARALLEEAGFSTRHARTALRSQLAGPPVRSAAVHLYDEAMVRDVAERPVVDDLDLSRSRDELIADVSSGWHGLSPWMRVALGLWAERRGSLPFLATVAGVVALGADIVGTRHNSGFILRSPGDWFAGLDGARLSLGPGRPWVLHLDP